MTHPAFDLSGKVALVTGGNRGIGLGLAEGLAMAGADVVIWGRSVKQNEVAAAAIARHGTRVVPIACDVGDEASVEDAFARSLAAMGRIDGCFANAGIRSQGGAFVDLTAAAWRATMAVNVEGVFFTFRAAARHMIARGGGGALVAMASTAAIMGAARFADYGASKGAVTSLVRALGVELARHDIRVNAILPGWIETEMIEDHIANEKFRNAVLARIPAKRWGEVADFGAIAVYLMGGGSTYQTGSSIVIDGGFTLF